MYWYLFSNLCTRECIQAQMNRVRVGDLLSADSYAHDGQGQRVRMHTRMRIEVQQMPRQLASRETQTQLQHPTTCRAQTRTDEYSSTRPGRMPVSPMTAFVPSLPPSSNLVGGSLVRRLCAV